MGGVDLNPVLDGMNPALSGVNPAGRIEKQCLGEFQKACALPHLTGGAFSLQQKHTSDRRCSTFP